MAKNKHAAKTAAATENEIPTGEVTESAAPAVEEVVPLAKMRGPRGVAETAAITLLVESNPKRPGSKANAVFSQYVNGMTVGEFCDKVNATDYKGLATIALVYDAAHGFIEIEGYTPPGGIIQPKEKAPTKAKATPKPKKNKKEPEVESAVQEEVMETVQQEVME